MAANIATQPVFAAGRPQLLFAGEYVSSSLQSPSNYDVVRDRFLMVQSSNPVTAPREITIVLNWFEELKRLVPTN